MLTMLRIFVSGRRALKHELLSKSTVPAEDLHLIKLWDARGTSKFDYKLNGKAVAQANFASINLHGSDRALLQRFSVV
jgi:hypothetical protein